MQFVYLKYELLKMTVKFTVEQILKNLFFLDDSYIRIHNTLISRAEYPATRILIQKQYLSQSILFGSNAILHCIVPKEHLYRYFIFRLEQLGKSLVLYYAFF